MAEIIFRAPRGNAIENPDLAWLSQLFLSPVPEYWMQGAGDAIIEFVEGDVLRKLLVLPSDKFEIYLKYLEGEKAWLSLENREKLSEVTECSDEWYASTGLFLPPEKAWLAIKEFCETGKRSDKIAWINPREIPAGGNWQHRLAAPLAWKCLPSEIAFLPA